MKTLDRKLLRDLRGMKGQVFAIVMIVACGVAAFVTVLTAYRGLKSTRDTYYERYRMADIFTNVKRAPRAMERELEKIDGVRRVEGRIVFEVTLDMPDLDQPASGRVISVPNRRRRILNDLHITRGRWFEGDGAREVIVADGFAKAHDLEVGDDIRVIMNNKKESLRVVGFALSPEFVYLIGAGQLMPDPTHFTVLWMSQSFAEAVFDIKDACNDFVALLDPGADENAVIRGFDRKLDRYGSIGAIARKDQISNRLVSDEIKGLKGSATMTPTIFLGVAAFVLHMLMSRLVGTQRTQIALLRAFGYSSGSLVAHYLKIALSVGLLGALVGVGLGLWFASYVLEMYRQFYSFPLLDFSVDPVALAGGCAVSLFFAALGAFSAARGVARLDPAEGMRAESPEVFTKTLFERATAIWSRLGFSSRMVLRHLSRKKMRAAITIGGVAMAASILVLSFYMVDAILEIADVQYRLVDRHDIAVTFHAERGRAALHEVRRLPGVRTAEAELGVPVRLVNGLHRRRSAILGFDPDPTLRALLDTDLRPIPGPREGLMLGAKLAELLDVEVGDEVRVEVLIGHKAQFHVPVEAVVEEYMGTSAYADLGQLSRWIGEEAVLTGVRLDVDDERMIQVGRALKDVPAVAGVNYKHRTVEAFRVTLAESQRIFNVVLVLFAGIITFGVVYNTARISLAERSRELGTMRVLGFTNREVRGVLEGENWVLTVAALPPGIALGAFFCYLLTELYDTDLFRFPFVLRMQTIFWTILCVLVFTLLANLLVRRRIYALDVVDVLKARE